MNVGDLSHCLNNCSDNYIEGSKVYKNIKNSIWECGWINEN